MTTPFEEAAMSTALRELPLEEKIRFVEDLWDSIAEDKAVLLVVAIIHGSRSPDAWRDRTKQAPCSDGATRHRTALS